VAETCIRGSQNTLTQNATMRMHQGKRRVIANSADVADMHGNAFQFCHQRPKVDCAPRDFDLDGGLDSLRESKSIGDCTITGDPAGEACSPIERCICHQKLDALMGVTEPFFQANHNFSIRRKPEVTGFNNPGVNRANGNLMEPIAFRGEEFIMVPRRFRYHRSCPRVTDTPTTMVDPATLIR